MKISQLYNKVLFGSLALAAVMLSACDKLDEVPDNRTEIDTPEKVIQLMASAYPEVSPAVISELSGDNLVDDNVVVPATHSSAYYDFHDEAYAWKDINNYSLGTSDTPYNVWQSFYLSISTCNHAIEAMKELSKDPANDLSLRPAWGEAHVLRAFMHFLLANLFAEAYTDDARNVANVGIPYVTDPETTVHVDYSTSKYLHNLKETYALIEKDLLEGIDCIDDNVYPVPAYHMNKNAANAFAARFYLSTRQYEKCLKYADAALGSNPSSMLRNWRGVNKNTVYTRRNSYHDETANCNFLIQTTYSQLWRMLVSVPRYVINDGTTFKQNGRTYNVKSSLKATLYGSGPCWSNIMPCYDGMLLVNGYGQQYGVYMASVVEYFEYVDKIAGIGYVHLIYHPLTADETLLCRAEAKLYLGDRNGAISDLNYWTSSRMCTKSLTMDNISKFYDRSEENIFVDELHPAEMGFTKVLSGDDASVLDCILHFRRIEGVQEGLRWFDIKRYGINITHYYRGPMQDNVTIDNLNWNDKRRVLQLPKNVIDAGYPANRTTNAADGTSTGTGYQICSDNGGSIIEFRGK